MIFIFSILFCHSNERLWDFSCSRSWKLCQQRYNWADVSYLKGSSLTVWSMLSCTNVWFNTISSSSLWKVNRNSKGVGWGVSKAKFWKEVYFVWSWTLISWGRRVTCRSNYLLPRRNRNIESNNVINSSTQKLSYHPLARWELSLFSFNWLAINQQTLFNFVSRQAQHNYRYIHTE